jgi:hypothetical protein
LPLFDSRQVANEKLLIALLPRPAFML